MIYSREQMHRLLFLREQEYETLTKEEKKELKNLREREYLYSMLHHVDWERYPDNVNG